MEQAVPNAATAKFQLALPVLLAHLAPPLAALHATRARINLPADASSLAATHCARCGTPFLASGGQTRTVRKKRKKSRGAPPDVVRVLRRSCRACGHDDDLPLNTANAPSFPKPRERARRKSSTALPHGPSAAEPYVSVSTQQHAPASQPRAPRPAQSSATPGSSRSSSLAPAPARSTPVPVPADGGAPKAAQPSASKTDLAQTKSRPKKKAGLQSLLARNREKQEQEKKRDGQGLSAFLQGL